MIGAISPSSPSKQLTQLTCSTLPVIIQHTRYTLSSGCVPNARVHHYLVLQFMVFNFSCVILITCFYIFILNALEAGLMHTGPQE